MLCNHCRLNNATKKCMMQSGYSQHEMFLCDECYEKLYNNIFKVDSDFISNIFGNAFGGFKVMRDKVCKNCGLSLSQFEKTGIAGCENCYNAFNAEIDAFIKKQQGKTVHIGKSPKSYKTILELKQEMRIMQSELEKATSERRDADTARLKKEIDTLSAHINKITGTGGNYD